MSKSVLRRLSIQIPEEEQPQFLASTFSEAVLEEALRLKRGEMKFDKQEKPMAYIKHFDGKTIVRMEEE